MCATSPVPSRSTATSSTSGSSSRSPVRPHSSRLRRVTTTTTSVSSRSATGPVRPRPDGPPSVSTTWHGRWTPWTSWSALPASCATRAAWSARRTTARPRRSTPTTPTASNSRCAGSCRPTGSRLRSMRSPSPSTWQQKRPGTADPPEAASVSLFPDHSDRLDRPSVAVDAPLTGTVVSVLVAVGDPVVEGRPVAVLESMKMEHEVPAPVTGLVAEVAAGVGQTVAAGDRFLVVHEGQVEAISGPAEQIVDLDKVRPDLAEVLERQALTRDEHRPEAVAKRHARGHRTARENLADLCDPDSFVEYGA